MTSNSSVVADASLLLKLVLPEEDSLAARTLWDDWELHRIEILAPALIDYEFVSAIRHRLKRREIETESAAASLNEVLALPVSLISSVELHVAAYRLAVELDVASTYDAHYLALADDLDCEFWTADERLYNAVRERFPLIRWLGAA